jgi:hypothetical protein
VPRKVRLIVALVLICLPVVAAIACQGHTMPLDHERAMPSHSHPSSSGYPLLDFSCLSMAAVLPTIVMFASLLFYMMHARPLVLKHTIFAFPPFIPPRRLRR